MSNSFPILSRCKRLFRRALPFLFLLAVTWYVWVWLVPAKPRTILVPFPDSDFVAFTTDSRILVTREPQWYAPPGATKLWDMARCPSRIQVWDTQDGALLRTFNGKWADSDDVIPTRDNKKLLGWAGGTPGKSSDWIQTCDLFSGEVIDQAMMAAKYGSYVDLAWSPDDKWLGISPRSGYVGYFKLWRVGSNSILLFDNAPPLLTFSENGEFLVASGQGAWEFRAEVWRLDNLKQPWKKHKWSANEGFVFPGCKTAATFHTKDFKIAQAKLWDLATGRLLATFPSREVISHVRDLNFPASGRILTNYVDWTASTAIWDISGPPKLVAVLGEWRIAISADRNWILQSEENGVHLLGLQSGKEFSLTRRADNPMSNQGAPGQFSPDSRMVIVTGIRNEMKPNPFVKWLGSFLPIKSTEGWAPVARLWAVETGHELAAFSGCTKAIFSPDSQTVAALQEDGSIHLWDVHPPLPVSSIIGSAVALSLLVSLTRVVSGKLMRRKPMP
jgi:WD40 repeat protein